jgi:hypothetical protein
MPQRISMNSLVNEDALPEWLRSAANSGALPPRPAPPEYQGTGSLSYGPYGQPPAVRPQAPPAPNGSGNLRANNLFDESALPEWLRTGAAGQNPVMPGAPRQVPPTPMESSYGAPVEGAPMGPTGSMGQAGAARNPGPYAPSAFPGIEQAGSFQSPPPPQTGMPAPSLIDSNALPQWLSGRPETDRSYSPYGRDAYGRDASLGIPAGSLVDETALPQWLRNEHPGASNQPTASSPWNVSPAAHEPMPSWLSQGYSDARGVPRMDTPPAQSSAWNSYVPTGTGSLGQTVQPAPGAVPGTIAAGEFIDESALPEWLRSQGGTGATGAPPQAQPPVGTPPTTGAASNTFSASDLIDPAALPEWVRGSDAGPKATFSSTSGWTSRQPVPPASEPPTPGISRNELPPWLVAGEAGPASPRRPQAAPMPARQRAPSPPDMWQDQPGNSGRLGSGRVRRAGNPRGTGDPRWTGRQRSAREPGGWEDNAYEDAGRYGNEYDDYDSYSGYDESANGWQKGDQREHRGGWRRFFGRK